MKTQTQILFEAPFTLETSDQETTEAIYPDGSLGFLMEQLGELNLEANSELEGIFGSVFDKIGDVVNWGKEQIMVRKAIATGTRDKAQLTNLVFFARHPERQGRKLSNTEPNFQQLSQEWLEIQNRLVIPILKQLTPGGTSTPTTPTTGGGSVLGDCIQQGTCRACERRLRAASPVQLVSVPTSIASRTGIQLNRQALDAYQQLYQAARANGIPAPYLKITSGYRSYDHQVGLWKGRLLTKFKKLGCNEAHLPCIGHAIDRTSQKLRSIPIPHAKNAWLEQFLQELQQGGCTRSCDPKAAVSALRRGTAPPGVSPHHTGRAVDLFVGKAPGAESSASTSPAHVAWQRQQPSFQWLVCNAARFGFYPYNNEPWHWEYNPPT